MTVTDTPLQNPVQPSQGSDAVEVHVERIEHRQRQIKARIQLPYRAEQVWEVLTDYEALSEFIPNLERSARLEHPEGGVRIEQVGAQSALMLKFSARVVLDMEEKYPEQLKFDMVEGDFKGFTGNWQLCPRTTENAQEVTELTYTVKVWPKRTMPVIAVEQRLSKDLPNNLQAIRQRLDELYGMSA
ncbi:SRPBCC family protein [Lyngbya confervoides]|uniref:SRPBCC family protein n=1 Tax=Lyngbya confervoides BDU141951 TaxID=1574623 RepID=A0ABD4T197_9CYAN|nr:SRPBCC family protein [Lyngbya confervoides]MCM1982077.1 SRPBCC family protein [Lyngbya confervoides BDU141951]